MRIFEWLAELRYRNGLLYRLGLIHFILFLLLIPLYFVDQREVLGINAWIKPLKFALSIGIYSWTIGWILFDFPYKRKWKKLLSWTIGISMITEIFIILYQASRATQSHFNFNTTFDGILFGIMGLMILINTIVVIIIFLMLLFRRPELDRVYLISLKLGLVIFLVSNYVGKVMIDMMAHSVGAEDGGPGLPLVNWSTDAGDLRVAHFLGLHAIQIIPLFAYSLKLKTSLSARSRLVLLAVFTFIYGSTFTFLYYQAINGIPFIKL